MAEREPAPKLRWRTRVAARLRRVDTDPRLVTAAREARGRLPGDERYGDPLSTAGDAPAQLLGQRLAAPAGGRPSAVRELGLGALQVWQALAEMQGRGHGSREVAIVFTDVVGFSSWALEAGDNRALELLRRVAAAVEGEVAAHGGTLVKRMGDGHMAVFDTPADAVAAARAAVAAVGAIELAGHRPRLRAGVHLGTPRRLGSDWFGVDVNVAARVGAAAGPGEVLVSTPVREWFGGAGVGTAAGAGAAAEAAADAPAAEAAADAPAFDRGRRLDAKGAPADLRVFAVR